MPKRIFAALPLVMLASACAVSRPPEVIALSVPGATGAAPPEIAEGWQPDGHRMLRNVSRPSIEVFRPKPSVTNGTGVLVIPGGGLMAVSIQQEGTDVARVLAARGVTAFVLKYRVSATPADQGAFFKLFGERLGPGFDPNAPFVGEDDAATDAKAAFQLIHDRAAGFGVDPARLGALGFSAGGILAIDLATGPAPRPAFLGDIYAPVRRGVAVPSDPPPMFTALAADDGLYGKLATQSFDAWRAAGGEAELHVYAHGGHGFGTRRQGTTSDYWLDDFDRWLAAHGWLKP
jgi:acetyl esterase/lipase